MLNVDPTQLIFHLQIRLDIAVLKMQKQALFILTFITMYPNSFHKTLIVQLKSMR
jgi:hypothetical protein